MHYNNHRYGPKRNCQHISASMYAIEVKKAMAGIYMHIYSIILNVLVLLQGRGVSRRPPLGVVPLQGSKSTGHHPQPIGARQSG